MKTYNEILVDRLRSGVYGLNRIPLCEQAADIIAGQDIEIKVLRSNFDEALQIAHDYHDLQKVTISRLEKMEKALRYINDNPWAHPENVKSVVRDALGIE